jgi:putative hydrolase
MLQYDLHIHSIRSMCGTMTVGEIVAEARRRGLRGIAVTDHGLAMNVPRFALHVFSKRFPGEVEGLRVYKGIELNLLDPDATVDAPLELRPHLDYVALGHHPAEGLLPDRGREANTDVLLRALERHPWFDTLVHPTQRSHPVDFARLLPAMARDGVAFEVNEYNHRHGKADPGRTSEVLREAVALGVPVVTNSDAHVFCEIGEDTTIRRILDGAGVDPATVLNADGERLEAWIQARRQRRIDAVRREREE